MNPKSWEIYDPESPSGGLDVLLVDEAGRERRSPAVAWAEGPSVPGRGRILWCLAGGRTVAVMVVTRRHRGRGGAGRYFDPGEAYADAWTASRAALAPVERQGWVGGGAPPWRRLLGPVPPLPEDVYKTLSNEG